MISNEDAAQIKASLRSIESKIEIMDTKLDDNAILVARYDERISNNKEAIAKNDEECKKNIDIIHQKIRESKTEAVGESMAKMKNWILVSLVGAMSAIIASIGSVFIKSH